MALSHWPTASLSRSSPMSCTFCTGQIQILDDLERPGTWGGGGQECSLHPALPCLQPTIR